MVRRHLRSVTFRSKTAHAVGLGALLGLVGALVTFGITASVRLQTDYVSVPFIDGFVPPVSFELYAILGCMAVGVVVAFLYERYRTVAPAVVATLVYLLVTGWSGWRIHTWDGPSGAQELIPPLLPWVTVYEYVVFGWPLLLAGTVLVAKIEREFGSTGEV